MNLGPKSHYWNNAYYRGLVEHRIDRLEALDKRKEDILKTAPYLKRREKLGNFARVIWGIPIIAGILFLVIGVSFGFLCFLFGILFSFTLYNIYRYLDAGVKNRKEKLFLAHQTELSLLADDASRAAAEILSAWDSYNESFKDYPPDWNERRYIVKKRDDWSCAKCGWPSGSRRLARNLHVHHIIPLSEGGDNALSNLITLCHVCHRKESGEGHKQIIYYPKSKWSFRRRRP